MACGGGETVPFVISYKQAKGKKCRVKDSSFSIHVHVSSTYSHACTLYMYKYCTCIYSTAQIQGIMRLRFERTFASFTDCASPNIYTCCYICIYTCTCTLFSSAASFSYGNSKMYNYVIVRVGIREKRSGFEANTTLAKKAAIETKREKDVTPSPVASSAPWPV